MKMTAMNLQIALAKGDYLNFSEPKFIGLDFSHLIDALWRSVATWVSTRTMST